VHFVVDARLLEPVRHRLERRHADAARKQDHLARVADEMEVVARPADPHEVLHAQPLVQCLRAAAAALVAKHGDHVALLLVR